MESGPGLTTLLSVVGSGSKRHKAQDQILVATRKTGHEKPSTDSRPESRPGMIFDPREDISWTIPNIPEPRSVWVRENRVKSFPKLNLGRGPDGIET